jgi:hypothetical protein
MLLLLIPVETLILALEDLLFWKRYTTDMGVDIIIMDYPDPMADLMEDLTEELIQDLTQDLMEDLTVDLM